MTCCKQPVRVQPENCQCLVLMNFIPIRLLRGVGQLGWPGMVASNPALPSPLPVRSPGCPSMRGQSPAQAMRDTCVTGAGARVLWPQMRMILYLFSSLRVATNFCSFFRSKATFPAADALGFGGKEGVIIVIPKRRVTTPPWMPLAVQTCVVRRGGALVPVKRQLWAGWVPPARQEGVPPPWERRGSC